MVITYFFLELLFCLLFLGEDELPITAFVLEHAELRSPFIVFGVAVLAGLDDGEMQLIILLCKPLILLLERLEKQLVLCREHFGIVKLFLELLEPFSSLDEIVEQPFYKCNRVNSKWLAVVQSIKTFLQEQELAINFH